MEIALSTCVPREPAVDLVRIISEGTYTSFAQSLKEFISNAYDADATRVDLVVDEDCSSITIRDNGVGMTLAEFRDFFASIGRTGNAGARTPRGRTRLGRRKIGRFGIGSLAIVGTAGRFTVRSVKRSIGEGFEASIDLDRLRKNFEKGEDLSKHWKFSCKQWSGESLSVHFTEVQIADIHEDVRSLLQQPGVKTLDEFFRSAKELSGLDELACLLGIICPVAYEASYPVPDAYLDRRRDALLLERGRELLRANFSVFLNGHAVRRPIVLPSYRPSKLKRDAQAQQLQERGIGFDVRYFRAPRGAPVHYEGYLFVQGAELFPVELQGLLIRLREVAIGWHRTLDLTSVVVSTMLPCLSGEVWVDGLEEALQFDRESFREDHPKFKWLRDQLAGIIGEEEKRWRDRSRSRTEKRKELRKARSKPGSPGSSQPTPAAAPPSQAAPSPAEFFVSPDIFDRQPDYVTRLVPQINGCWERGYYEACAMTVRRLLQTLIIHLYHSRGWVTDLQDTATNDFLTLKRMIDKLCGDARIGLDKRCRGGLKELKELGDIAAHDFRVRIRRSDLERMRSPFRYACERLIFKVANVGP